MRALIRWVGVLLGAWLLASPAAAQEEPAPVPPGELHVFVRDGCPYCADAERYLPRFAREHPQVRIVLRHVDHDPAARAELARRSRAAGIWPPGVPTFAYGSQALVGFESPEATGSALAALVGDRAPRPAQVEAGWLGTLSVERLGLPAFTLALGLLDGFNPCAMWVLLFLLALLVRLRDRRRMALVAGTFVLASGAVYYAFMAAWLNLFLLLGLSAAVRFALGATAVVIGAVNVKDAVRPGLGISLSIPQQARPRLVERMRALLAARGVAASLAGVVALAVAVNFLELLCTAGLPALYTAVLSQHEVGAAARYAYLALYIVGYIADDAAMVTLAVLALANSKMTAGTGRALKLLSGAVMLLLGATLLLRPGWLAA